MSTGGQRGSGFVGLQSYLGLNRAAGEKMGNDIAEDIEERGGNVKSGVDTATKQFTQNSGAGETFGSLNGIPDAMRNVDQANRILGTPTEVDLSKYTDAADKVSRDAALAGTDAGRAVLLRQKYGNSSVGGGMLDAALAGRGGGQRLENDVKGFKGLREYLGTAKSGAESAAAEAKKGAQAALGQAGTYLTNAPSMGMAVTAPLAPPAQVPRLPTVPQVGNEQTIADENKRKARYGYRG